MRRKRTGNTWRLIAAFALSTVLILDGLSPAWSAAAGPDSFTDRSYQDAGYAGPYGLARFISGNGAASLEVLLYDVLGEGQISGVENEPDIEEDAQDILYVLNEAAQPLIPVDNVESAFLEMLGWNEDTDMSQRLVGSWGIGADDEYFLPAFAGFEGEWIEEPDGLGASSDSMDTEWLDDGWYEDDWREERGHEKIEEDRDFLDDVENKMETLGIEPDADDNIGADRDSARMPAWKAHSHNQEREGRREITAGTNRNGFIDDGGETSNSISADGADGDSSSDSGSSDDSQDSETPPSGNDGGNGDGQGPEESSGGGYEEGSENPDENDDDDEDGSENNGDSDEDLDNDDREGNDAGDQSGNGDEKNNEEVVEDDEEQKDPMQEEPAVYISSEGVWDGSIAASFAGGTGTASDPYLISNGAELAYLAQQVNSGTTYSGKYFLQTADIILNQYVLKLGAVQGQEPVLKDEDINDENSDVEQDADEPEEDGVVGDMSSESETSDEAENVRSDELSSHNGEAENDAKVSRAVSSATTAPEDKWSANDGDESESNGDANVKNDLDEAEGDSHLEEESNDEKEDEQQTHSLRTGNEPLAWTPIGYYNSRSFQGTYDGDGFEISGIYINTANDYQGLFGYANGTVKNIQITNTSITGGSYVGGIAGYARWVENCRNYGRITGKDYVGGLAGRAVDIYDGVNEGEIQAAFCAGGLAGDASSIARSRNEGSVTVEGLYAGGLGGYVSSGITDSINAADVSGGGSTGGLAGYASWTISGSINYGNVAGDSLVGGLAGQFQKGTVEDCRNEGNVSGEQTTGGILGFAGSSSYVEFVQIRDCSSSGDVRASGEHAGGILGQGGRYKSIEIEGCIYEGSTVSGSGYVGGIAGYVVGSVVDCVSSVDIHVPEGSYVGGIAGYAEEMKNCRNYGSITGRDYVGGLAGRSSSISESANVGAVQAASYGGGLAGNVNGAVSGSRNEGSVTVEGLYAGGLGGYVSSGITDSINTADVSGGGSTGGLAGYASWTISGSINYGSVAGDSLVGGLAGQFQKGTVEDCRNEGNVSGEQTTGGILGFAGSSSYVEFVQIRDCSSSGDVRASGEHAGGILGQGGRYKSIEIEGCIYEGSTVSGSGYVGGIAGYVVGSVVDCVSSVDIHVPEGSYVGGIAGYAEEMKNCRNYGSITGRDYVGGLAGRSSSISESANVGAVQAASYGGGLAGNVNGAVSGSRNEGSVTVEGLYAGGLGGYVSSGITDSINTADVSGGGSTGGLAGYASWTISGSINYGSVAGDSLVGGLAGQFQKGTVEDCRNEGNVSGEQTTGGILGFAGSSSYVEFVQIRDCSSSGDVRASGEYAGGILGQGGRYKSIEIEGCIYEGSTVSGSGYVGGIAGYVVGSVVDCVSSVDIYAPEGSYVGGIAGYAVSVESSGNYGSIEGKDYVGGLAGRASSISESINEGAVRAVSYAGGLAGSVERISDSRNEGSVTVQGQNAGGLGGYVSSGITDSVNTADVRGGSYTGGLAGYASWTISGSINYGSVAGDSLVGGLAGHFQEGTVEDCRNEGNVSGEQRTGGILGIAGSGGDRKVVQIRDCSSSGDVRASGSYAGGILGQGSSYNGISIDLEGCINEGNAVSGSGYVGGIAGSVDGNILNCRNSAEVHAEDSYAGGVAGYVKGGIADCVNLVGIHVPEGSYIGGIAGHAGAMENCRNYGSIEGKDFVGGIAGRTSSISDSINEGAVQAASYAGGLAGNVESTIESCENYGTITSTSYTGGIAGYAGTAAGCENYGIVQGETYTGGIAGQAGTLQDCRNEGTTAGGEGTGGIAGLSVSGGASRCINLGDIYGTGKGTGGIIGISSSTNSVLYACENQADITGAQGTGGILGSAGRTLRIEYSRNSGTIQGGDHTGGILGSAEGISGTIAASINEGPLVSGGLGTGGIAGYTNFTISESINRGEVTGTGSYIGGIAGRAGTLKDIVNNIDITGAGNYTGGLAGYAGRAENCYNTGTVSGAGTYNGGIAGQLVTAVDCTNKGTVRGRDYTGGIAGDGKDLSGCWNTGTVQGEVQGTGGIAGYSTGRIEDCHNSGSVSGGLSAGGIAGSQLGTVSRSRNMGMVSADSQAGGITGFKSGGAVEKSLNTGYILFQETGGGIAGAASSTQIRDAYSLGAVTGRGEGAGGIAGQALSSVRIINCYNTGIITGRGYTGGLAGFGGSGLSLTNSYYILTTAVRSVGYEWGEEEPDLTLEEMSMRVNSSKLQGMASDLGSAYDRDRQGINGGYPILIDVDYTSQPPQIGARPSPFSLGYGEFAVTAVEKMSPGSALEGAQVDLGSFGSEETDSSGTAVFSVGTGGGRHHLDVELEGYRRYFGDIQLPSGTNPHMIDNNSQFLAMLTPLYPDDSTVPYISTLMYYPEGERTVDVLTSSVNILTGKKAELVMNAEWNGKAPGSYVLFQLNGARLESSSGIFSEKLGDHFLPGEAIYAQVRAADSTMGGGEATGIQLVWGDTEKYVVSFFDGTAVKLPGFIPIPDIIPNITGIDVEVEFDDTKIRVYVGVKDTEVKRRLTELKKEAGGYGMENVKRILRSSTLREKMNWGALHVDMRLLGYAEWRMEQKNFITHPLAEPFVFKGDVGAIGELKGKATHTGLFMAGPVPLYYRLGAGLNLDTELSAYVDLQRGIFETKDGITFTPEVGAEGGVGLPDLLSGGLDLAVKLPITLNQDRENKFSIDKVKLTGKANLKAAILGFVVEQDLLKMFFGETPEMMLYDRDDKKAAPSAASLIDISPIFDAAQFKPNPMEYAKSGSEWMAGAASESMTAEELFSRAAPLAGELTASAVEAEELSGELLLQTNINQESRPQTASIPGMTVAAWTVNDTSRGVSANWPLLVYSVLDEAAGTWSTPAAVLDDGTGDFYPVLKEGGGSIWISWQNAGKAFEEAPQSLEELAGELEAAAAVFDAGTRTFVRAGNITDNDVMDLMPVIAADAEGRTAVVWRTNSAGDLFGTSGTTSIWAMDLQTEDVQKLWETEKPVVSMDAGYRNGRLTAAIVADGDGDLTTADDRTLYLLSAGAAPVQAAGSSMIGGAPVFSRYKDQSVVFYSTDGMLKALFEDGSEEIIWEAEKADAEDAEEEYAASPGIGDFSAAYDAEGRVAVIWTGMQENMTMQTQVLLYDSSRDEWSRELRTESSSGSVVSPSAAFGSDGTLRVLYGRMMEDRVTGMEQMDLCLAELVLEYGIAVEEIWYDPYDEIPGEDLPVGLVVSNTGSMTIEQIVVDINGEETVLDMHLLPGEEVELQVMHPVGNVVEPAILPVKVSALDEAGSTAASDRVEFAAGYADAELSVQEVTNAWGQTAVITAGSRSWNTVSGTLEIRLDSADGPVIERISLGTLAPDQAVHYSYGVPDDLRQGGRAEKLYFVLKTDQPELFTENNIDYINLI